MTGVLFLKELREAFASRRFWVIPVLSHVLLPLGVKDMSLDEYFKQKKAMFLFGEMTYGTMNVDRAAPAPRLPPEIVPLEKRLAVEWIDFILLVVYGTLFFANSIVALLRYDVR